MAGLSVILEHQNNYSHVINKTSLLRTSSSLSSTPSYNYNEVPSTFLEQCYLCHKKLQHGHDIYMYRGDRAFCSIDCRCRQICMDEESGRRSNCSLAAVTGGGAEVARGGGGRTRVTGKGRAIAGGFVY